MRHSDTRWIGHLKCHIRWHLCAKNDQYWSKLFSACFSSRYFYSFVWMLIYLAEECAYLLKSQAFSKWWWPFLSLSLMHKGNASTTQFLGARVSVCDLICLLAFVKAKHPSFTSIHTRFPACVFRFVLCVRVCVFVCACDIARWQWLIARYGSNKHRLIKFSDNVKVYVSWETRGSAFCIPPAITRY